MIDLRDFADIRAIPGFDNTPALNQAVLQATPLGDRLLFPPGIFAFARAPAPIGAGVLLTGAGPVGASKRGTVLWPDFDLPDAESGFLTWDGHAGPAAGTGGGIDSLTITRPPGRHGGSALVFRAISTDLRAGWIRIDHLNVNAFGTWSRCVLVDGMAAIVSGSAGVRNIHFADVNLSGATSSGETALFRNALQVTWMGGYVYPAGGLGAEAGITLTGGPIVPGSAQRSMHVDLVGVQLMGRLICDHVESFGFTGGRIQTGLTVTGNAMDGRIMTRLSGPTDSRGLNVLIG